MGSNTFYFEARHVNRVTFPTKHIAVCEDDLHCQQQIINHLASILEPQGDVIVSVYGGAIELAAVISSKMMPTKLIILDYDMPYGNGLDLLTWLKLVEIKIPVITFSGVPLNNLILMEAGANYIFLKTDVINGKADDVIKTILSEGGNNDIPKG